MAFKIDRSKCQLLQWTCLACGLFDQHFLVSCFLIKTGLNDIFNVENDAVRLIAPLSNKKIRISLKPALQWTTSCDANIPHFKYLRMKTNKLCHTKKKINKKRPSCHKKIWNWLKAFIHNLIKYWRWWVQSKVNDTVYNFMVLFTFTFALIDLI